MASDYSILENELKDMKMKLKRDLHMHQVRQLGSKLKFLQKNVVQRHQIENLSKQLAELEPAVSTVYCPQNAVKDSEIQGYLVYLLKMKDYFTRQVITKQEMIKQRDSQIEVLQRKLCVAVDEQAKIKKSTPRKSPEYVRLENMSDRMNQMNKRISIARQENKEIVENIMSMRKFQAQFKIFEKDFRRRIVHQKNKADELLDKAVAAYEEKEEFMNKGKVFDERSAQDARKTAINMNALNLFLRRTEKNEDFARLQDVKRTDIRIAETSDMIQKGITGLEPSLEKLQTLQSDISAAAGEGTPEKMEENFKFTDHKVDMMFSYVDELLRDIHQLQDSVNHLKKTNRKMKKNMSQSDRKLRKAIEVNKDVTKENEAEAEDITQSSEKAKGAIDFALDTAKALYVKICPGSETLLQEKPLDDSNVLDYLQKMEAQVLYNLICLEYIRMQEASEEDKPIVLEADEDEDVDEEIDKVEDLQSLQSRTLSSEYELETLKELDVRKEILEFQDLKERAIAAIAEVQSETSGDEEA